VTASRLPLPSSIHPDVRLEIERLNRRIDEVERQLLVAKSEMRAEVASGFDGVQRHLDRAIPAAVEGSAILASVKTDLATLISKAQAAEDYRVLREKAEKDVTENALKLEELQAKRIANRSGEWQVYEAPVESKHRRRLGLYGVIATMATALAALIGAAIASHH
jgi:hypothetical protein